jgi:hypothetical protein
MGLPNIQAAYLTKQIVLPISNKKIKIRPFLAKEEKLMLMVKESQNPDEIADIICQVMDAICLGEIKTKELPAPDTEALFLAARCLSKGETSEVTYICRAKVPDLNKPGEMRTCSTPVPMEIRLDDVKVVIPEGHTKTVKITGTPFAINFRYPTLADSAGVEKNQDPFENVVKLIESVSNLETGVVYDDFTKEELNEFLDSLPFGFMAEAANQFLSTMPTLSKKIKFKCPSCGHEEDITVRGLTNFF